MITRRSLVQAAGVAAAAIATGARARSGEVAIGILFPTSGPNAQVGIDARHAIDTALDIVNNPHPDLDLPLAAGVGLPGLGGAKLRVVAADHQSSPQTGRSEAERLIAQEKVCALLGSYQSAVAASIAQVSEQLEVPYVSAENSSPSLTRRGLRYIFRPGAHDDMFSATMFDCLDELRRRGSRVETVALFAEDTLFGTDSANTQRRLAGERGYKVVADIKYRANAPTLAEEVRQLKEADADVLMPSSYTRDGILLVRGMAELGYRPRAILAQNSGFSDRALYDAVGRDVVGCITRASFPPELAARRPLVGRVNALFRARSGKDLNDLSARQFTGALVLAEAIDRAQGTDGPGIRDALAATDIPGERTIMPWKRVTFDETGQNRDADPVLLQWTGERFVTVYPSTVAVAELRFPMGRA
ncbi:ABC transporter substrate-binding protein [Enterovirga aerilata]|uniref:ABC transporter substrate-binding protein n=1 Tax=Enterovirga aerilata TaxID=2730920 RepID=A0A849HUD4_9HYPH|nr:ABC transporter substrate-binding protein [Enterovirga sp. DB1703]NNM71116.1 ABC transporter substrate-binding protein [Enterovirga sp. DB1703]